MDLKILTISMGLLDETVLLKYDFTNLKIKYRITRLTIVLTKFSFKPAPPGIIIVDIL